MPSTYTLNNGIELIATGEQSGTWGDTTNTNFELLDTSLDGQVTVTLASTGSSGSPNTLPVSDGAASNGRNRLVIFDDSSDLGGTAFVQLTPSDAEKIIYVRNSLSGSRSILLFQGTYNASNDYEVPAGTTAVVFFNGAGAGAVAANVFNNAHFDNLNVVGDGSIEGTLSVDTINEFTSAAGVTIDTVLLKDDVVNASDIETSKISANDGTTAINIANSTGAVDIDTSLNVDGTVTADGLTVDGQTQLTRPSTEGLVLTLDSAGNAARSLEVSSFTNSVAGAGWDWNASGSTGAVQLSTAGSSRLFVQNNGDITFFDASGNASFVYDESAGSTFNEQGADRDFRVESDNSTHALFVNAAVSRVGIKTASPDYELQVGDDNTNVDATIAVASAGSSTKRLVFYRASNKDWEIVEDTSENLSINSNGITGKEFVINNASNDTDFRIRSDNKAHMLFVDAGNDYIGINQSSPVATLDVQDNVSNANGTLRVYQNVATGNPTVKILQRGEGGSQNTNQGLLIDIAGHNQGNAYILNTSVTNSNVNGGVAISPFSVKGIGTFQFRQGGVINENGADSDFRVESDSNANMLFVDASANSVGIGSAPDSSMILHVKDTAAGTMTKFESTDAGSAHGPTIELLRNSSSPTDGDEIGRINFNAKDSTGVTTVYSQIENLIGDVTNGTEDGTMAFNTIAAGSLRPRLTLRASEAIFNENSFDTDFRVESDGNSHMLFVDGGNNKVAIGGSSQNIGTALTLHANDDGGTPSSLFLRNSGTSGGSGARIEAGYVSGYGAAIKFTGNPTSARPSSIIFERVTASGPTYATSGEFGTTGIFKTYNGVVFNESSNDVDFRVESDAQSNCFLVDGNSNITLTNSGGYKARFESNGDGQRIVTANVGHTIGMVSGSSYALGSSYTFIKLTGGGGTVRITANNNGVNLNNNATSFSSASDIRLKNITGTFTNAIEDVKTLEPVKFTWKHDTENTPNVGFTAQSVQPVLPEAVDSNDVFDDGNEYLSVRYTEVIPLLTAALQEAITKIETLEARITALENA